MSRLNCPRGNCKNHNQSSYNQSRSYKGNQGHAATACRELPTDNPVLALNKAMESHEENQNGDTDKGRAKGFP